MNQEYTQQLNKIEAEIKRWLPDNPDSVWTQQIFTSVVTVENRGSIDFLTAPVKELIFRGGKRWRPLLMTLVCETLGGKDAAIPLSPLTEFTHNASLIHDDIEDESDERRGKPAIHKIFGVDTAINSGSFLYFLASCCIESCGLNNKDYIYKIWTDCLRRLHLGQAMDISWHRDISLICSIEEYYLMCKLKTGSLARLAVELGIHAAGISPQLPAAQALLDATDKMGVGFQILDDVKNLTTGIPGKKRGDDIVEGKKSLPVLLYLQKYPEKRDIVFYYFQAAKEGGTSAPEVDELIEALTKAGILTEAEEKGRSLLKEAQDFSGFRKFSGHPIDESALLLLEGFVKLIS